jgi:hypothetical protein
MQEATSSTNEFFAIYKPFLLLEFFTEESKETVRDFICFLCGGIYYDPKVDSCGHTFCNQCITTFLMEHDFCPVNRSKDFKLNAIPSITRLVNRQSLFCKNRSKGCEFNGLITQYSEHKCDWEIVSCENENCKFEVIRKDLNDHSNICEFRKVKCDDCTDLIIFNTLEKHNNECLKKLIPCELNCNEMVMRELMKSHVTDLCDNTVLVCQFSKYGCTETPIRKNYKQHNCENISYHNSLFISYFEEFQNKNFQKIESLEKKVECLKTEKAECKIIKSQSIQKKRKSEQNLEEELKNSEEEKKSKKSQEEYVVLLNDLSENDETSKQFSTNCNSIVFKESTYGVDINENEISFTGKSPRPGFAFATYTSKPASVISWKLNIKKIINWIGIGLISKDNLEVNGYSLYKPNNFLYAITSDGRIYENKEPVQEHFSLYVNDNIEICYNQEKNTVLFRKPKLNITLHNVFNPKEGVPLVPCLILNNKGDRITVIS